MGGTTGKFSVVRKRGNKNSEVFKPMKLTLLNKFIEVPNRDFLMNKTVEWVKEVRNPIAPTVVLWYGETVDEYFSAAIAGGTVMLHLSEREYQLRYGLTDVVYVGGLECVLRPLSEMKHESDLTYYVKSIENLQRIASETREIVFQDVMDLLGWKFKNEKIEVDTTDFTIT
jgi:hypothetical protein